MTQREFANRAERRVLRVATAEEEGQLLICVEDNRGYFVEIILPAALAPAVAVAVLEAAGMNTEPRVTDGEWAHPGEVFFGCCGARRTSDEVRNYALGLLKLAQQADDLAAKPTVTDEQVAAVQAELSRRGGGYRRDEIRDNLQAALDSRVLVPADPTNKEAS